MDLRHGISGDRSTGYPETQVDVKQPKVFEGNDGNKHLTNEATTNDGDLVVQAIPLGSSSSWSSSSSDISQLNENEDAGSMTPIDSLKFDEDTLAALKDDRSSVFGNCLSRSEGSEHSSEASTLTVQVLDVAQESVKHGMSPTLSPAIQTMERSGGYDPSRIPSAVFDRSKSTTPMEWSLASNESLFSIHVGNNSFSREQVFMSGKSGELIKSSELLMFSPVPPLPPREIERRNEVEKDVGAELVANKTIKDAACISVEDPSFEKATPAVVPSMSSKLSARSEGSVNSTRSFAFPV